MFKRQTRSYQSSGIEHSPFARAAQAWDQRIGSARVQARNWRIMAFAAMGLVIVLVGALLYQSAQTRIAAYVVQIDPRGSVGQVKLIDHNYTPTAAQIAFHLGELVRQVRSRPTDPVVLKQNWQRAYHLLAGDAVTAMNQYASKAHVLEAAKEGQAVAVQILSVIQRSDASFQVRWKETNYEHGAQASVTDWTGLFTTRIVPPKNSRSLFENPLGVYVTHFSWSQEYANN